VLESFYEVERQRVAELMRSAIAFPSIDTVDTPVLLRALELYELDRLDFAEGFAAKTAGLDEIESRCDRVRGGIGRPARVRSAPALQEREALTCGAESGLRWRQTRRLATC
jgi:hypothetical protein